MGDEPPRYSHMTLLTIGVEDRLLMASLKGEDRGDALNEVKIDSFIYFIHCSKGVTGKGSSVFLSFMDFGHSFRDQ